MRFDSENQLRPFADGAHVIVADQKEPTDRKSDLCWRLRHLNRPDIHPVTGIEQMLIDQLSSCHGREGVVDR